MKVSAVSQKNSGNQLYNACLFRYMSLSNAFRNESLVCLLRTVLLQQPSEAKRSVHMDTLGQAHL